MKINGNPDGGGGGSAVIEGLSITSNGTYTAGAGVDGYSPVEVDVPEQKPEETFNVTPSTTEQTITPQEGYVFTSGVVGSVTSNIDANIQAGNIKSGVTILGVEGNYTAPAPVTETLNVSVNNTYYPGQGVDGFSQVVVDVQPELQNKTVVENGEYIADQGYYGLGTVTVSVPSPQFVTESLSVSVNGTYTPGAGVDGYSQVVVDVPQSVTGYTQKEITEAAVNIVNLNNSASYVASYAFEEHQTLETVSLPNCTSVYHNAFQSCNNLRTVDLPVCENIGQYAFQNCYSLTQVNIPVCKLIQMSAFAYCPTLQTVNVTLCESIGQNAFYNCLSLNSINIGLVKFIGAETFYSCRNLVNIDIPYCSYIGGYAFKNCSTLQTVNAPRLEMAEDSCFQNCYSLSDINIPLCSNMRQNVFRACSALQSISIPDCGYINPDAFAYCQSLSEIYVGFDYPGVTTLANTNVFYSTPIASGTGSIYVNADYYDQYIVANNWSNYASQIVSVVVPGGPVLSYSNGSLYGRMNMMYLSTKYYISSLVSDNVTSIDLPECIKVGSSAFKEFHYLSEVSLPKCEYIDQYAFQGCFQSITGTASLVLPVCSYIGYYGFHWATKLSALTLGSNSVCRIRFSDAFFNCPASFYVPASLVDAYKSAEYWSQLSSRIFPIE